jgi:hypothetical protein
MVFEPKGLVLIAQAESLGLQPRMASPLKGAFELIGSEAFASGKGDCDWVSPQNAPFRGD